MHDEDFDFQIKLEIFIVAKLKKGPRITVTLSGEDHDALQALAAKYDVSLSWLTRHAIAEFIEKRKDGQLQLPLVNETEIQGKFSYD